MARIRTIKPAFWVSLTNSRLTLEQRVTFIGLWTHCDDGGRCVDNHLLIAAAVWPLPIPKRYGEPGTIRKAEAVLDDLDVLAKEDKIIRYVANDVPLLQVTNWRKHQVINRPTRSEYPPPEGYDWAGRRIVQDQTLLDD